jgi:uncharacterized membrane protein (DUF485 family)
VRDDRSSAAGRAVGRCVVPHFHRARRPSFLYLLANKCEEAPLSTTDPSPPPEVRDWESVQSSPEFQDLRHRLRSFVFPVTGLFLGWYLLYVLAATYAPDFMSAKIGGGNITVGLIFGLLQFVSTFAITIWYVRYSNRRLDPLAEQLRDELERGEGER